MTVHLNAYKQVDNTNYTGEVALGLDRIYCQQHNQKMVHTKSSQVILSGPIK